MHKPIAVAAPYTATPLKISTQLRMAEHTNTLDAVCPFTGVAISLQVPAVPGFALEYTNPLSIYKNCQGLIEQGEPYLVRLDSQVLAGMVLTVFKYYDLFAASKQSAALENALLRTAGKPLLIEALILTNHINNRNSAAMPQLSLDYIAHSTAQSFLPPLHEYLKLLRGIIWPSAQDRAEQAHSDLAEKKLPRKRLGLSDIERQYEEELKDNKRIAKGLIAELATMPAIPQKLINYMRLVCSSRNLVVMDSDIRAKLVDKLTAYAIPQCTALAKIVKDSYNPYDMTVSASLDRASDTVESVLNSTVRKRSLADILAEKRAKAERAEQAASNPTLAEQVAEHFVQEQIDHMDAVVEDNAGETTRMQDTDEDVDLAHEEDIRELMREQLRNEEPDRVLPTDYSSVLDGEDF